MSTNHYTMDLPEPTLWWPHPHQQQLTLIDPDPLPLNLNNDDNDNGDDNDALPPPAHVSSRKSGGDGNSSKNEGDVGVGWTRGFYPAHHPYPTHHHHPSPYHHQQDDSLHAVRGSQGQNQRTRPVGNSSSSSSSSSRVLRLFGVNMECQPEHDDSGPSTPQCSYNTNNILPSTQGTDIHSHLNFYQQQQTSNSKPPPHHMMIRHQPYYY
ncbi:hypothetical protein glysoja_046625 [Glycine soja]|uniref:Uncharacterized protein n=1 Tax=Glycine soja TaxID=3848 RepID=A0A0B2QNR6_GLYSO|nr:hypothetical protein glysoja_046625 [Glycine soja]